MQKIKIGIVEDEMIIAENISMLLRELDYSVCTLCGNYDEALAMVDNEKPDIVLLDIRLAHSLDGIEVAKYIRSNHDMPIIFLTANSDKATVDRAKEVSPNAYLIKPFQKADLHVSIEIALHNHGLQKALSESSKGKKSTAQTLFIKDGEHFHKVSHDDIFYLSSDHVYVTVHTAGKKFLVRSSMQDYLEQFDADKFIKVHRSYVINFAKIEKIHSTYLVVGGETVPISKNHREQLMKILKSSS